MAPQVNITVQSGLSDPVTTARTIDKLLTDRRILLGGAL